MNEVSQNKKSITENRKRIFSIDAEVMTNKALIYASRSMIEENRLMILSNYAAAFMGNDQDGCLIAAVFGLAHTVDADAGLAQNGGDFGQGTGFVQQAHAQIEGGGAL